MTKNIIKLLTTRQILQINKMIVTKASHVCVDPGKIESALHAAYYPGTPPFQYGEIEKMAGALCFFIMKAHAFLDGNKRTAGIAATVFLAINSFEVIYTVDTKKDFNPFADIIDKTASNKASKVELITWFQKHTRVKH